MVEIDFTYPVSGSVAGDDDIQVTSAQMAGASGTIKWLGSIESPSETTFNLTPKANGDGIAFRFGDENDDLGHRGHPGLSGWGWLMHNGYANVGSVDWLFSAVFTPLPPAALAGLAGLGMLAPMVRRGRRRLA